MGEIWHFIGFKCGLCAGFAGDRMGVREASEAIAGVASRYFFLFCFLWVTVLFRHLTLLGVWCFWLSWVY